MLLAADGEACPKIPLAMAGNVVGYGRKTGNAWERGGNRLGGSQLQMKNRRTGYVVCDTDTGRGRGTYC